MKDSTADCLLAVGVHNMEDGAREAVDVPLSLKPADSEEVLVAVVDIVHRKLEVVAAAVVLQDLQQQAFLRNVVVLHGPHKVVVRNQLADRQSEDLVALAFVSDCLPPSPRVEVSEEDSAERQEIAL